MKDDGLFTIGQLARRTGLSTRTIRFYSDAELVPETSRSQGGYRIYDVAALARLELIRTLRDLGLGLAAIRELVDGTGPAIDVVRRHVATLDAEIAALSRRRAVLRAVVTRESTTKELILMTKLATMSDEERQRIITEFWDETFADLDINPGLEGKMRSAAPVLGDDPAPEQVEAWVELAELATDPDFRARVRTMAQGHSDERADGAELEPATEVDRERVGEVMAIVAQAVADRVDPVSPEAGPVADRVTAAMLPGTAPGDRAARGQVADLWETWTDPRVDRFWALLGVINGWPARPDAAPLNAWVIAALRAGSGARP